MKRGERRMWRKLESAVTALAKSDDYAREYIARREIERIVRELKGRNAANIAIFGVHLPTSNSLLR